MPPVPAPLPPLPPCAPPLPVAPPAPGFPEPPAPLDAPPVPELPASSEDCVDDTQAALSAAAIATARMTKVDGRRHKSNEPGIARTLGGTGIRAMVFSLANEVGDNSGESTTSQIRLKREDSSARRPKMI
jgi:hypothetical protein